MRAVAVAVAFFALVAPARATFMLHVDATTVRGHLRMLVVADPGTRDILITEGGRPIPGKYEPFAENWQLGTANIGGGVWKCTQRDRTFVATGTDPAGAPVRSPFTVRTPSCANRLTLRTTRRRATIVDSFGLGGVRARVCARVCRTVAIPRGSTSATVGIRGRRVVLRTRFQRLVRRVGAHPAGGPVVLTTGDSLMQNLNIILQDRLGQRADLRTDIKFGGSLSFEGYYGPWADIARAQVTRFHPRATVIFLGTNDVFPIGDIPCCGTEWGAAYEQRARATMAIYAQGGAGSVVWLTVPYARDKRRHPAQTAVNAALRRAAAGQSGVTVVPIDDILSPGGVYRRAGREPDGIHLSLAGSRIAARYVLAALRAQGVD